MMPNVALLIKKLNLKLKRPKCNERESARKTSNAEKLKKQQDSNRRRKPEKRKRNAERKKKPVVNVRLRKRNAAKPSLLVWLKSKGRFADKLIAVVSLLWKIVQVQADTFLRQDVDKAEARRYFTLTFVRYTNGRKHLDPLPRLAGHTARQYVKKWLRDNGADETVL